MDQVVKQGDFFVFTTTHKIVYNTSKPVPIKEIILALQGLDGVLKTMPKVVAGLTGCEIDGTEFLIQSIESGSLIEDIIINFLFKDRASLDAFVAKMENNKVIKTAVISTALVALTLYGLQLASPGKPSTNITANNNVIINVGAAEAGLTPEAFAAVVRAAVGDKKGLAESSLKLIGPARADTGSTVAISDVAASGSPKFEITAEAISDTPKRIELQANERIEEYKHVVLTIRATNLDSKKLGWAGKLGDRDERLPIELDPAVSESDIFGREKITVDAALVFREKGRSMEMKATRIYVRQVLK